MTSEQGLEIFWKGVTSYPKERAGIAPYNQTEAYKSGIEAVIKAIDQEYAEKYLNLTYKFT